ncbi:MAG: hypothetical protein ACRYFK_16835 [Janthinobacterium lividum]
MATPILLLELTLAQLSNFGSFVSGIAGAIATIFAYKAIVTQKNSNAQAGNLLALNEFMMNSYVNRKPITYREEMKDADFIVDREQTRTLFKQDPEQWRNNCLTNLLSRSQQLTTNEISHSLQHLGLAAFVGTVPLSLLLVNLGDSLVLDWMIIKHSVDMYRQHGMVYSTQVTTQLVYAKRRHAEWLALIAFLWLTQNWHYEDQFGQVLTKITGDSYYGSTEQIKQQIRNITIADRSVLSDETKRDVHRLTGLRL